MKTNFVIVEWPESQQFMDDPRFNECELINSENGIRTHGPAAYLVPTDLYETYKEKSLL